MQAYKPFTELSQMLQILQSKTSEIEIGIQKNFENADFCVT